MTLSETRRYTIAGIQVYGGLLGFAGVAQMIGTSASASTVAVLALGALFFLASFAAGVLLLRDHPWGAPFSMWMQFPQLVAINTSPLLYNFYSGVHLGVEVGTTTGLSFNWNIGAAYRLYLNPGTDAIDLTFNIAAIVILLQLFRYLEAKDGWTGQTETRTSGGLA